GKKHGEAPLYCAVMECIPMVKKLETEIDAFPLASTGALPIEVIPSKNVTVPVAPVGETCAVNTTFSPQFVLAGSCVRSAVVVAAVAPTRSCQLSAARMPSTCTDGAAVPDP